MWGRNALWWTDSSLNSEEGFDVVQKNKRHGLSSIDLAELQTFITVYRDENLVLYHSYSVITCREVGSTSQLYSVQGCFSL